MRGVVGVGAGRDRGTGDRRREAKAAKLDGLDHGVGGGVAHRGVHEDGHRFQKANKGTTVTFNFAASSALATQIQGGAPADVFASADGANMQKLVTSGQVTAEPTMFASNLLTIVVKPGNPKKVKSLADLAKLDVVSLCGETVPCGKYADADLSQAGVTIPTDKVTAART